MTNNSNIKLTIAFNDPDLDSEERDVQSQRLMAELRDMDEVEAVDRVMDPNPPEGNKSLGGAVPGMLAAEIKPVNFDSVLELVGDRYAQKCVEIEIEVGDRKIKVTATSQAELMAILPMMQQFLAQKNDAAAPVHTILIFAANPQSTSQLRLDQEVRDIAEGLKLSIHRDDFDLDARWAVRPRDMQRAMLDKNPRIVHFCGHSEGRSSLPTNEKDQLTQDDARKLLAMTKVVGTTTVAEGLVLEDETGQPKLVDGASLASLFKLFADQVECVILNSCFSQVQAEAIAQYIPYVIGMNQAIGDKAAIEFAVGFYDALGAGRTVEFAYELGCSAIRLAGIAEYLTPVLIKKPK
jgi:CHAT domain